MIFTLERLSKMPFPFMLRRRRQWFRWCLSKVEVEYSRARGLFLFRSKVLFVPRWSKSWQMHATSIPKISACKYIVIRCKNYQIYHVGLWFCATYQIHKFTGWNFWSIQFAFVSIQNIICATLKAWYQLWYWTVSFL